MLHDIFLVLQRLSASIFVVSLVQLMLIQNGLFVSAHPAPYSPNIS